MSNSAQLPGRNSPCVKVHPLGHAGRITSAAFSPDGSLALSASRDSTLRLWSLQTGECLKVLEGHSNSVNSAAFSPDGSLALSASGDMTLRLWSLQTGECLRVLEGHSSSVNSAAFSPDGSLALSASDDSTLRLWSLQTGECLRVLEGHSEEVNSAAFSPDGSLALSASDDTTLRLWSLQTGECLRVLEGHSSSVNSAAFSPDGSLALSASRDSTLRLWSLQTGECLRVLEGHSNRVNSAAFSPDGSLALSASDDGTLRLWSLQTGECLKVLEGHSNRVNSAAFSPDGTLALSASDDGTLRLWSLQTGECLKVLEGHSDWINSAAFSPDGSLALSASDDGALRLWSLQTGECLKVLEGHSSSVRSAAFSPDGSLALSASYDCALRLWSLQTGECLRVLKGHSNSVNSAAFSPDGSLALSASYDSTLRLWSIQTGECLRVLEGHSNSVRSAAFSPDGSLAFSMDASLVAREWDIEAILAGAAGEKEAQVQYKNAKVLLVGNSAAGKTGLNNYLVHRRKAVDSLPSTDGAWATQMLIVTDREDGVHREIWLWDFAGQIDYRMGHKLFFDEAAAAVLVFDPQDERFYDTLAQWSRDLAHMKDAKTPILICAARADRGGLRVSRSALEDFCREEQFSVPIYITSALTGEGCDELKDAVVRAIPWSSMPTTSSPELFKKIKDEVLRLRDQGVPLMTRGELGNRISRELQEEIPSDKLRAVLSHLAGPGIVKSLDFGDLYLLQPDIFSRYASALIRRVRQREDGYACILESEVLRGDLDYQDAERIPASAEALLLMSLVKTAAASSWCIRQHCDEGHVLIFPSFFRRERPDAPTHPQTIVTYTFAGLPEEVYATLVVKLHYSILFETDQRLLYRDSAEFRIRSGGAAGFSMTRRPKEASLDVYFDVKAETTARGVFLKCIEDVLKASAKNVQRHRSYFCSNPDCDSCGEAVPSVLVTKAIAKGRKSLFCPDCGKEIDLNDAIEQFGLTPEARLEADRQSEAASRRLLSQSVELLGVFGAGFIAAQANSIYRILPTPDHGIDAEIEFLRNNGDASGKKLYLQIKSGDSHLRHRARDDRDIFDIPSPRHVEYWTAQSCDVMLVIRTSDERIRWMNVTSALRRAAQEGRKVTHIEFDGEEMTVESLRTWRRRVLGSDA